MRPRLITRIGQSEHRFESDALTFVAAETATFSNRALHHIWCSGKLLSRLEKLPGQPEAAQNPGENFVSLQNFEQPPTVRYPYLLNPSMQRRHFCRPCTRETTFQVYLSRPAAA